MRLAVQRVNSAQVKVSKTGKIVGKIGKGLFILLGVKQGDAERDVDILAEKLVKLRVIADDSGKMNYSVKDVDGEILVASQFTLYADTSGGNRPSFIKAAEPVLAEKLYKLFVSKLRGLGIKVETGSFGEYMEIDAELDGPVTIVMESGE